MSTEFESTATWKVDITQLKASMQEAKRSITMANSEFKKATAGMDSWSKSTTGVEAKIKQLDTVLVKQKSILGDLNKQYEITAKELGETSPQAERLRIQINNQEAAIKKTESQLKQYNSKLKELEKAEKDAARETNILSAQIDEQQRKLNDLKGEYKDAVLQYGKNSKQAKDLAKQIKTLSGELKDNQAKMSSADKAADKLDKSMESVSDSADRAKEGFTVFKGVLANLATDAIRRAAEGMVELAKKTLEVGMSFESGMSRVKAISGANAEEMEQLTAKAKEMGETTIFSASQSSEAFNYMAMAGWEVEDMLGGIEGVMNLAAASGEDLATTSDIVTDALTAMGYKAGDAGHLADVMAAASSNANTNVGLMGETFQYAAPLVGALKYSMEDTAVAIGMMANAGIKGDKAGTALRSILTRLAAPPKECALAMEELGVSLTDSNGEMKSLDTVMRELRGAFSGLSETQKAHFANSIAGKNAISGLLAIVNGAPEDFEKLTEAVRNSSGASKEMADTMNDNVQGQITLLKSKVEGIMIKIFENLSGSIREALDGVSNTLDGIDWNNVADKLGKFAKTLSDIFIYLLKNADKVIKVTGILAGAIGTAFAVKKIYDFGVAVKGIAGVVKSVVLKIIASLTAQTAATTAATAATTALNVAMMALPWVALAAGVAALAAGIVIWINKQKEAWREEVALTEEQKKQIDTIHEHADAYRELAGSRQQALDASMAEFGYLEQLQDEYNGLIDSNGKVKEGYEDRANFILNQLAQSMGMELEDIKALIDENGRLGESIDKVIEKKKAEAALSAMEEEYKTAIKEKQAAFKEYSDALALVEERTRILEEAETNLANANTAGERNKYKTQIEEAKKALEEANGAVGEATSRWEGYNTTIQNYEGMAAAIISGDQKKIEDALIKSQYQFKTAETATVDSLRKQVRDYEQHAIQMERAIKNGTPGVTRESVNQAWSMVNAARQELDKAAPQAAQAANNAGSAYANTLGNFSELARNKSVQVANSAKSGFNSVSTFPSGENAGQGYIDGINSKSGNVVATARNFVLNAINAMRSAQQEHSPSKVTKQSGVFFGEGYIQGIKSMTKLVRATSSDFANNAIDAMAYTLGIHSPSTVARDKIGINIAKGVVDGLNSYQKNTLNALKKNITSWWAQINNLNKQKSRTNNKTTQKSLQSQIDNLKKKINTAKSDIGKLYSSYNSDLIDRAQSRLSDLQKYDRITLEQEVTYWDKIVKSLKKGANGYSAAYYTATGELKMAKRAYNDYLTKLDEEKVSNLQSQISRLKSLDKISLAQEADYWANLLKKLKKGTQAYKDAEVELYNVKKNIRETSSELANTFTSSVGTIKKELELNILDTMDKYKQAVNSRAKELANAFGGVFSSINLSPKVTAGKLTENLKLQVDALKAYDKTLSSLEKKLGSNSALVAELREQGVESLHTMQSLDEMSTKELNNYVNLYNQRASIATKRATVENKTLKSEVDKEVAELKKSANKQIQELTTTFKNGLKELGASVKGTSKDVGTQITAGIKAGISEGMKDLTGSLRTQTKGLVDTVKKQLKIKSPSQVFRDEIGKMMPPGIAQGFTIAMPKAESEMQQALNEAVNGLKSSVAESTSNIIPFNANGVGGVAGSSNTTNNQVVNFNQTINSPKAVDRLTLYRQTNSLLFGAKVRLNNV